MKKFILLILSLINTAVTAVFIAVNPNEVLPSHFGVNGNADAYASKWALLLVPCILVVFSIAYAIYAAIKEKDESYKSYKKYAERCIGAIFVFLLVIFWVMQVMVLQNAVNIGNLFFSLISITLGCMFAFINNLMPKIKQNSTLGFKTRATLNSKRVWKKVHRLAAYLGVIGGITVVILGVISLFASGIANVLFFISLIIILVSAIIPAIYGEIIYSKEKKAKVNLE
ncbi:MAG: SdpI family protein [Ruminococcus sp.]